MASNNEFLSRAIYPKHFFLESNITEKNDLVFVLMPFTPNHDSLYRNLIKPSVEKLGLHCLRADEIFSSSPIMQDILRSIMAASIVVADVTGRNPNVFYELGIAHAVKDRVIMITQSIDDVPFDLKHIRTIVYDASLKTLELSQNSVMKDEFVKKFIATIQGEMKRPSSAVFKTKNEGVKVNQESVNGDNSLPLIFIADRLIVKRGDTQVELEQDEFAMVTYLYTIGRSVHISHLENIIFGAKSDRGMLDDLVHRLHRKLMRLSGHPTIDQKMEKDGLHMSIKL